MIGKKGINLSLEKLIKIIILIFVLVFLFFLLKKIIFAGGTFADMFNIP